MNNRPAPSTQPAHAFGSLLLRTLLAATSVGTAIAGLLMLGVFGLVMLQTIA